MVVAGTARPQAAKLRWSELDEDEGGDLDFLLPPRVVTEHDENGIRRLDENGNKVKVTTGTRVRKVAKARLTKEAIERRGWGKFADAVQEDVGSRLTMISTEEILLERPRAPGTKTDEVSISGDALAAAGKSSAVLMVCRTCGKKGDHWTSKCPYKDLVPQTDTLMDRPSTSVSASSSTYVPPSLRGGGAERGGAEMGRRRNEENSIRVTNLSEDATESDLRKLFETFGDVIRAYVPVDKKTGVGRGFGFVNFKHRDDAVTAINKLNGYGYGNLILRIEWATPRPN